MMRRKRGSKLDLNVQMQQMLHHSFFSRHLQTRGSCSSCTSGSLWAHAATVQSAASAHNGTPRAGKFRRDTGGTHQSILPSTVLPHYSAALGQVPASLPPEPHRQQDVPGLAGELERAAGVRAGQPRGLMASIMGLWQLPPRESFRKRISCCPGAGCGSARAVPRDRSSAQLSALGRSRMSLPGPSPERQSPAVPDWEQPSLTSGQLAVEGQQ